jgi:hypothetical protein
VTVPRRARDRAGAWAWWLGVGLASVAVWAVLTWPFAIRLGDLWQWAGDGKSAGQAAFMVRDGSFHSADHLQNIFIDSVVVDNARSLREPYLDLREGVAGPAPLRTTSLNLPWTPVVALLWPLFGLVAAYNATLLLSSVAAALAAFGLLRRHTTVPLLAAAGALVYAASPHRMFQLTVHFNAVMWWAFPAAAWAFEAMVERWREGRAPRALPPGPGAALAPAARAAGPSGDAAAAGAGEATSPRRSWAGPAVALVAVVLTVGVSGEYHLALFMTGLIGFLSAWTLAVALVRREPLPLAPVAVAVAAVGAACAYVLAAFAYVFRGTVEGGNGSWGQVLLYAASPAWLVRKAFGEGGEGLVYVGWVVVGLALAGLAVTLAAPRRRLASLPYAVLLPALLFATFGPRLAVGTFEPYRFVIQQVPFLSFQRVPQRLMVVTALVLVLLAVVAADRVATALARAAGAVGAGRLARAAGAVLVVVVTALVLADYRVSRNLLFPSESRNAVVERLAEAGDAAGPVLGLPAPGKTSNFNAAMTYVAAVSRRRTLNAYNQTPAPWLDDRLATLWPLTGGQVTEPALAVLRETGTRHVVVIDDARMYPGGEWRAVIDRLTASGAFRLVVEDGPMALLERTR